jgi:hypothetical protein
MEYNILYPRNSLKIISQCCAVNDELRLNQWLKLRVARDLGHILALAFVVRVDQIRDLLHCLLTVHLFNPIDSSDIDQSRISATWTSLESKGDGAAPTARAHSRHQESR